MSDWQNEAICAQTDPRLWFIEPGESPRAAKEACAQCPVRARCLQEALTNREPYGVWGGLTERERLPLLPAIVCANPDCEKAVPQRSTSRYCCSQHAPRSTKRGAA